MKVYRYSALTHSGEIVNGELAATDPSSVIEHLHQQSLLPIDASEIHSGPTYVSGLFPARGKAMPGRDLALACQQLSRLLRAGLPLDRALAILSELAEGRLMRRTMQLVLEEVQDGASLAEAFESQGKTFSKTFITLVRAGEMSGALQAVLAQSADFLTASEAIRQKIISALVYPIILVAVAALSVGVILVAVLPQFEPMFKEAGAKLPLSTQIVVAAGDVLREDWWILLLAVGMSAFFWRQFSRSLAGKSLRDRMVLRIPILKHLVLRFEIGRFCRTLGVMLANGVAAPSALGLAASTMGNTILIQVAEEAAIRFREGEALSTPLARSKYFLPLSIQLIRIGEETGRLDEMLIEIAVQFDQEVQRTLERMLSALVPGLTLLMGCLIALIVGAVMSALMTVNALAI